MATVRAVTPLRFAEGQVSDDDDVNDMRLSFFDKKMIERSRLRTLEKTVKSSMIMNQKPVYMPKSPAISNRMLSRFSSAANEF